MPLKMANCCRGKAVLISVYVERPRNRTPFFHKPRHSYHRVLLPQPVHGNRHGETCTGYSKKARLLLYTQQKRETIRQAGASRPSLMNPISSNASNQPRTPTQVVAAKIKSKRNTIPSCFGNWKRRVLELFRPIFSSKKKRDSCSGSTWKKIKVKVRRIQVQKKCPSISNLLVSLRK